MRSGFLGLALMAVVPLTQAFELQGEVDLQHRQFIQSGSSGENKAQTSVAIQPEIFWQSEAGNTSFEFSPFYRWDSMDDERTHFDIREALLLHYSDTYEVRVGVGTVFWGVTESQHLVDVINQTDAVESVDGEVKLGQPMLSVGLDAGAGWLELYLLPYFRERAFAGEDGRLLPKGLANAQYESDQKQWHLDTAARFAITHNEWDLGVSAFHGTNREPYYVPTEAGRVAPYYALMTQLGLDVQAIYGNWLWKAEAIRRISADSHTAFTGGVEYTHVGFNKGRTDLGVLVEYLYDSRGEQAPVAGQNDIFAGVRWVLNDMEGTEILLGGTIDLDNTESVTARLESSGRFNNDWSWKLTGWMFDANRSSDPVFSIRQDDFIELEINWYF